MHILNRALVDRRTLLRAGAVALGLPLLDAMIPAAYGKEAKARAAALQPRRMVLVHRPLGTYHPHLVPKATGLKYEATRFLKTLEPLRGQFTVFSGMGHPGYPNSHGTEPAIFTGVAEFNERVDAVGLEVARHPDRTRGPTPQPTALQRIQIRGGEVGHGDPGLVGGLVVGLGL